jgi:DNA (cytosine-5)-methyltransferase 1
MGFTTIDLFAGIGGFRAAVERCGGSTIAYAEIDRDAIEAYTVNYPSSTGTNLGDITALAGLPPHDLLTAGVPCQSWSIAGRNLGFDDDRGQLWNDALFLLRQSQPKAFIFENVKGLADPRNAKALGYIMSRIKAAGYSATPYVLNSFDYGVPQSRVRIYIVGFRDPHFAKAFSLPGKEAHRIRLKDIIEDEIVEVPATEHPEAALDLFGEKRGTPSQSTSLSKNNNGHNDYFLFNDIRNGPTTIHSWDIIDTTRRQKEICLTMLRNRRRKDFGPLDGNPLSLAQLQSIDQTITIEELEGLISIGVMKSEDYAYRIEQRPGTGLSEDERLVLGCHVDGVIVPDRLVGNSAIRTRRIRLSDTLEVLRQKGVVSCCEARFEFRQTKISTGLYGVGRIFLPSSDIFPTLVASDTNDHLTPVSIAAVSEQGYKRDFLTHVFKAGNYRKVSRTEALRLQGFPDGFVLPEARPRWMKLLGNSVAIPVVEKLVGSIVKTGVFA